MAAEEQQHEAVVGVAGLGRLRRLHRRPAGDGVLPALPGLLAAQQVGQPARGDADQPGQRVVRPPLAGPLRRGREQRLLHGVLARVEATVAAHERAEDLRREPAQQVLGYGWRNHWMSSNPPAIGRMSTYSPLASGFTRPAAISVARSKLAQSTIVKPASTSCVSGYGPSVTTGAPFAS